MRWRMVTWSITSPLTIVARDRQLLNCRVAEAGRRFVLVLKARRLRRGLSVLFLPFAVVSCVSMFTRSNLNQLEELSIVLVRPASSSPAKCCSFFRGSLPSHRLWTNRGDWGAWIEAGGQLVPLVDLEGARSESLPDPRGCFAAPGIPFQVGGA